MPPASNPLFPLLLQRSLERFSDRNMLLVLFPTRTAFVLKCQLIGVIALVLVFCIAWVTWIPNVSAAWPVALLLGGYNAFLHTVHIFSRSKKPSFTNVNTPLSSAPFVSILIPAHNEENVIWNTVQRLQTLNYPNYEILVIDDRSTDGTRAVLDALANDYQSQNNALLKDRFRYFTRAQEAFPGKSAALNDALHEAKGDLLLILDADGHIPQDFLAESVPVFEEPRVAATQAPKQIENAPMNILTRWQGLEYELDAALQSARSYLNSAVELRGNGMIVRRSALNAVGNWTLETVTDDLDLSTKFHKAGFKIVFTHWTTVSEEGLTAWRPLFRQRTRWAQGSIQRFLQYGVALHSLSQANLQTRLDSLVYSLTFLLPITLMLDVGLMLAGYRHWLSWFGVWGLLSLSIGLSFFWHLLTRHKQSLVSSAYNATLSTACMLTIWFPVVTQASLKLFMQHSTIPKWVKTQHGHVALPQQRHLN